MGDFTTPSSTKTADAEAEGDGVIEVDPLPVVEGEADDDVVPLMDTEGVNVPLKDAEADAEELAEKEGVPTISP